MVHLIKVLEALLRMVTVAEANAQLQQLAFSGSTDMMLQLLLLLVMAFHLVLKLFI